MESVSERTRVLLVSGSLRESSTNTALLRTAAAVPPDGVACRLYDGASLPPFNPDRDRPPLAPEVDPLRQAIHESDAIVFSTPEHAGALPGSFKNLLDWTIGDESERSIDNKAVCWLNAAPRGAIGAHRELLMVLEYAHALIVDEACAEVPTTSAMIGPDGLVRDRFPLVSIQNALAALHEVASRTAAEQSRSAP